MSRADAAERMLQAAIGLGTSDGVGALTLQGIATASGVSKALVLYHYDDKDTLLGAVATRLATRDVQAMRTATEHSDVLAGWRNAAGDPAQRAERALLVSLLQESALRPAASALFAARVQAGAQLAQALLASAGLRPRVAGSLLGRMVVTHLDGIAVGSRERSVESLEADLDATALALLGLGVE